MVRRRVAAALAAILVGGAACADTEAPLGRAYVAVASDLGGEMEERPFCVLTRTGGSAASRLSTGTLRALDSAGFRLHDGAGLPDAAHRSIHFFPAERRGDTVEVAAMIAGTRDRQDWIGVWWDEWRYVLRCSSAGCEILERESRGRSHGAGAPQEEAAGCVPPVWSELESSGPSIKQEGARMGLVWDLIQHAQIKKTDERTATLEERVEHLEEQLWRMNETLVRLIQALESRFGEDLDGDTA